MINSLIEKRPWLIIAVLLGLFSLQAILYIVRKPWAVDDFAHLAAGYTYIKIADFRFNREEPPLIKVIAAAPLIFLNPKIPTDHPSWEGIKHPWSYVQSATDFVMQFFFHYNRNPQHMFFVARLPLLGLSLLLGYWVFKWTRELYGVKSGLLALFFYSFCPNILANSLLINTDLGLSLFTFIVIYYYQKFLKKPSKKTLFITASLMDLALITKFSAFILPIICSTLWLIYQTSQRGFWSKEGLTKSYLELSYLVAFFLCSFFLMIPILFIFYGPNAFGEYFAGVKEFLHHLKSGHPSFLMGMYSNTGWWYYFLVAFIIKTPLPTIILFMVSLVLFLWPKWGKNWEELFLVVPILFFFIATAFSRANIGLRHILPIYPFIFVLIGRLASLVNLQKPVQQGILFLLASWYLIGTIKIYPDYLTYFNELIGGPKNGHNYLSEPNLSYGQDTKELKRFLEEKGIGKIKLQSLFFGISDYGPRAPEIMDYYDIPCQRVSPQEIYLPANGFYVIDILDLQNTFVPDKTRFLWIKLLPPLATVGNSLWVYQVNLRGMEPEDFFRKSFAQAKTKGFLFRGLESMALNTPYLSPIDKLYHNISDQEKLKLAQILEKEMGDRIGVGGKDEYFLGEGWSGKEIWEGNRSVRWSSGKESSIFIPAYKHTAYKVVVNMFPFYYDGSPAQRVSVYLNGDFLTILKLSPGWRQYSFSLMLKKGVNRIVFRYSYTAAPKEVIRGSNDSRELAVSIDYMDLQPT